MLFLSPLSLSLIPNSHHTIVIYKTAYYSFYLPVACAMLFSNIPWSHEHIYAHAKSILLPPGEYFQIQDDFLDYSVMLEVWGKIGTDTKCSWVVNTASWLTSEGGGKNTQQMRRR